MATMNQEYFDRPETLRLARGEMVSHRPEARGWQILDASGHVAVEGTNGGILNPRAITIERRSTLVRFGNAPFASDVAGGSWWLDWSNYKIVERFADARKIPVASAMRMLCAVPVEWSTMTMLVQATARSPLSAYIGRGNLATVVSRLGVRSIVDPNSYSQQQVEQLFIPGLSSPDLRKASVFITGTLMLPQDESIKGYDPQISLV